MPGVAFHSVPHFARGRTATVNLIVIHQFAGGTVAAVQNWLRNPASRVSYHFGVGRNGEIRQWVSGNDTAWATGPVNGRSIAIGHEATNQPLTGQQLDATARIIRWARGQYRGIPAGRNGLGGHRQFMTTNCPGNPIMGQLDELQRRAAGAAPGPSPPPAPPAEPELIEEYEGAPMQLRWHQGSGQRPRCQLAIPTAFNRGSQRIRFACAETVELRVDWAGNNPSATIRLSGGANGAPIPRDVINCNVVLLSGDANAPVDCVMVR